MTSWDLLWDLQKFGDRQFQVVAITASMLTRELHQGCMSKGYDAVVSNLERPLSRQLKVSLGEPSALRGLVKVLGTAKAKNSHEAAEEGEDSKPLCALGQPTIDV